MRRNWSLKAFVFLPKVNFFPVCSSGRYWKAARFKSKASVRIMHDFTAPWKQDKSQSTEFVIMYLPATLFNYRTQYAGRKTLGTSQRISKLKKARFKFKKILQITHHLYETTSKVVHLPFWLSVIQSHSIVGKLVPRLIIAMT